LNTPTGTVLFGDEERQKECSDHLALKLKFDKSVFFEGSTWAQLRQHQQQMGVHCDTLNDLTLGYEVTGVLSFITFDCSTGEGICLCAIRYTQKACCDSMMCLCKANASLNIYGITALLFKDKLHLTSTGMIIKGAALLWLRQHARS